MSDPARIQRYRAMVDRFPQSEVPRYSLASALIEAGELAEAETHLRVLLEHKPDYMMAAVQLAQILTQQERWDDALEACDAAIALAVAQDHKGPLMDCEALRDEIISEIEGI